MNTLLDRIIKINIYARLRSNNLGASRLEDLSVQVSNGILRSVLLVLLGFVPWIGYTQCLEPVLDSGLYCNTDHPESPAPIICSLDCLDGFTGSMPDMILPDQPETLCGFLGTPNNLSWFAFIAGDTLVDLTITPFNCVEGDNNLLGIQAGIYSSCSFEAEDVVVCFHDCIDHADAPVNLTSDEFIPGEIYYLFVDGCGGSVCDYTVTVNSAMQPFEVPEITTISNTYNYNLAEDTICQGATVAFRLDDLDLDINYSWTIYPSTSAYPTGVHPLTDTNTVSFVFSDEGVFDIVVYAYNECDANEPDTFQVTVAPLGDEIFSDVSVCEECLEDGIVLVSPDAGCIIGESIPIILTEDPNDDGVPGWQGLSEISSSGLQMNMVQNVLGCGYTQTVNIIEIPRPPREEIDLYFCFYDFPLTYDGVTFNNPGDQKNIIIEKGAVSGCDSLISITAHAIDLVGNASVGSCTDGLITIAFNLISVEPLDYDSITYIWYDELGNIITDADGVDNEFVVSTPGSYTVEVSVHKGETTCPQLFGSYDVDASSLVPAVPMIGFAPNEICINESESQIYINNQGIGEEYTWTIQPDLPFTISDNTDTVFVSISSGQSFEYCVTASNGCGVSDQFCDVVIVSEIPNSEFIVAPEVCIDSTVTVEYIGGDGNTSGTEFYWSFDDGVIVNIANVLSAGPFELQFPTVGEQVLTMYLLEGGCESDIYTQMVTVVEPFDIPQVDCHSFANAVAFSFDDSMIDGIEVSVLTGQSFEIASADSIIVSGLGSEDFVEIEILFNDDFVCGGQLATSSCSSLPCPSVALSIALSSQDQCIDENDDNIELDVVISGDDTGSGAWQTPFLINGDQFDVNSAGSGSFPIVYQYTVEDCTYSIDTVINIFSSPSLDMEIERIYCDDDVIAELTLEPNDHILMINGVETDDNDTHIITSEGSYLVTLINEDGCRTEETVEVSRLDIDESIIIGNAEILKGNKESFETNSLGDLPGISYVWSIDGEVVCMDCLSIDIMPEVDSELCMTASYADGCSQEVCLDLTVAIKTELYVPNIFSPNGDGMNDFFKFQSNSDNLMIESVTIFDRWGEVMFEASGAITNEETIMWDGTFNGSPCNNGVYIYVIKYLDTEGEMVNKVGDVTLMN